MKPGKLISARLKALREEKGISQQELATRADLSLSLVAKLEQGKKADPRASTLINLAAALGVKPGQLIDDLVFPSRAERDGAAKSAAKDRPAEDNGARTGPKKGKKKKKKH
jgi:transcriptional regulator with XRE-family HTH domain